jgi:ATP-dependent DNA ligase
MGRSYASRGLNVSIPTDEIHLARDELTLASVEGVVAKRADRPYVPGRARDWVKVKRQRTVDCVVVGVAGEVATPKLVLALRHADGELQHSGRLGGVICTRARVGAESAKWVGAAEPELKLSR